MDGDFVHASKVCADLESGLIRTANDLQTALTEMQRGLEKMLDIINEARVLRGLPKLDLL